MYSDETIKHHMAIAFFASAYADQAEECEQPLRGEIMDQLPETVDPAAIHAARTATFDILRANNCKTLSELMEIAEEIQKITGITGDRELTEEMFGHYLAMQAIGHGVGLNDAFGRVVYDGIIVPYIEFGSRSLERDYFECEENECPDCGMTTPCKCHVGVYSVAPYLCDRAYGGPEEGGWYYDCGTPETSEDLPLPVFVIGKKKAYEARRVMQKLIDASGINEGRREIDSVLSEGIYHACICDGFPKPYPEKIPHYE